MDQKLDQLYEGRSRVFEFPKPQQIFSELKSQQVRLDAAARLDLKRIRLDDDGSRVVGDLWIDNLVIPDLLMTRNGEGRVELHMPTVRYSFVTDERYLLSPNLRAALYRLAERVLPPMLPYGWNQEAQHWIHAGTPMSERISEQDLQLCRQRIASGPLSECV
jgi:hypothetical protein